MKRIFIVSSVVFLVLGVLFINAPRVQATIAAIFEFSFTESVMENVSPIDTAIDRATGTVYVLTGDSEVRVFDTTGAQTLSFDPKGVGETFSSIAIHPVSKNIYLVSSEEVIKIFDDEGTFVESYGAVAFVSGAPTRIAVDANGSYVTSEEYQAVYFFNTSHILIDTEEVTGPNYIEAHDNTVYVPSSGQVLLFSPTGVPGTPVDINVTWSATFAVRPGGQGFGFSFNTRDGSYVVLTDENGDEDTSVDNSFRGITSIEFKADDTLIVALNTGDNGNIAAYDVDPVTLLYYLPKEGPGVIVEGSGMATDAQSNVFIVDASLNQIKKYNDEGEFLDSFGSQGSGDGQFASPVDVALDDSGNIYVADRDNSRVQVFDANGTYLRQWAVTETGSYEGPLWLGVFDEKVYVTGRGGDDRLVQVFSLEGSPLFTFGGTDGLIEGQFDTIDLLTVGKNGQIYVFDNNQNFITVFSSTGTFIERFNEFTLDGVPDSISFELSDMAVDEHGNIFLADYSNYRVLILDKTFAQVGSFGANGNADGEFSQMRGIALTEDAIYVGDSARTQAFSYSDDVVYENNDGDGGRRIVSSGSVATKNLPKTSLTCEGGPFTVNLRAGARSAEVIRLQRFLENEGVYKGPVTGFFGPLTYAGVTRFQVLHQEEILTPLNLKAPTGNWYQMTRAAANRISGCKE